MAARRAPPPEGVDGTGVDGLPAEPRPRLSVVTPTFNSAAYLPATLESVAAITSPHEHIVIDGLSTDGTIELIRDWADRGVRWVSEPDRGQTHAVNKGLERARGDIVAWVNGDDEVVPEAIDRAVGHFDAHPACDVVYAGIDFMGADGTTRREYRPAVWSWHRYLLLGDYIPTPAILFRRSRYQAVGPLDERWADAADYDFYLRLMRGARVDRLPGAHVRFRYHDASKTATDVWRQQDEALQIRLGWSRSWRDRAVMLGFDRLKRAVLPVLTRGRWPAPY
jgi:glycosyltransferase involved in cell wall biosynthesis